MGPQQQYCSGGPGFFNLMFANQFKRITQVKLRGFILKVTNWGTHLTFLWTKCNNQERIWHMEQCPGPRAQTVRFFLVFTCIWQENIAKIPKRQGPNSM